MPTSKHARDNLSKQVQRIESEVSRLRTMLATAESGEAGEASPETIRAILDARRRRDKLFPSGLFADPGWDILLELYAAKLRQEQVTVGYLCNGAAVPATTALGWIKQLDRAGLLVRIPDKSDRRRILAELSDSGAGLMTAFFGDCGGAPLGI